MAVLSIHVHIPRSDRRRLSANSECRVVPTGQGIHVQVRGIHAHQRRRAHQSNRTG